MNSESIVPAAISAVAGVIALIVAQSSWRWRATRGGIYFVLLMASVAVFAITNAAESASASYPIKIAWTKISYLGVVNVPPLLFLFAVSYSQNTAWLTQRRAILLWFIPAVFFGLAVTNELHGLIWYKIVPVSPQPGARLIYAPGLFFYIHTAYAYFLLFVGIYWLIRGVQRSPRLYRLQVTSLILAALFPAVANLLYILKVLPWPGLDPMPIALVLTGLVLAWNLSRYKMFDLMPVARNVLFENLGSGVIVIDEANRILDINPTARSWINWGEEAIGRNLFDVVQLDGADRQGSDESASHSEVVIADGDTRRVLDLSISPLHDRRGVLRGRVVLLHDISNERGALEAEHRRVRQMELLNAITRTALSIPDYQQMIQTIADRLVELFRADSTYMTVWNDEQRAVPTVASSPRQNQQLINKDTSIEKSLTEAVLNAGHVLVVEDALQTPYTGIRSSSLNARHSWIALPLISSEKKLGAALIYFDQQHRFSPEETALAEQAADQIALAVAKAQLLAAERRSIAQLTALQSISQAIASSLDLDQIFTDVVSVLHHTFGYQYVSIYRLDGNILRLGAHVGYPDKLVFWEIPISHGIIGRTVRTQAPQFVPDVSNDPGFLRASYDVASEISVPLIKEQTVLGVLNIESPRERPLSDADLNLLTSFASQVVMAIDHASLYQAERDQRELAEALREIGTALSESLDFETVLDRLLDGINRVVPYDTACVMLVDETGKSAQIRRMAGYEQFGGDLPGRLDLQSFDIATTANLRCMYDTRKPLIIPYIADDPGWITIDGMEFVQSWAGAPIVVKGKVIAFFSLDKATPSFYRPEDAERLAAFAGQAAIAIENARLFTETQLHAKKERLLLSATRDFTARLGEEAVLHAIAHHMVTALGGIGCTISRWDPGKDCVSTLLDYSISPDALLDDSKGVYPLSEYPATRYVIENCQPLYLRMDDPDIEPGELEVLKRFGNQSVLMFPLAFARGANVLGIIELFRKADDPPLSDNDLELAQSLAAQAATAMDNARLYAEVQRLAIMDELTGLYNRRGFFDLGRREFERAVRLQHLLAILFVDIDHFKVFNDTFSYATGDHVLRILANCLRENLRDIDLIGRYGGEEFVILLPESDSLSAFKVAERIRLAVENMQVLTGRSDVHVTVSIGVSQNSAKFPTLDSLIDQAGTALHEAKNRGRNTIAVVD